MSAHAFTFPVPPLRVEAPTGPAAVTIDSAIRTMTRVEPALASRLTGTEYAEVLLEPPVGDWRAARLGTEEDAVEWLRGATTRPFGSAEVPRVRAAVLPDSAYETTVLAVLDHSTVDAYSVELFRRRLLGLAQPRFSMSGSLDRIRGWSGERLRRLEVDGVAAADFWERWVSGDLVPATAFAPGARAASVARGVVTRRWADARLDAVRTAAQRAGLPVAAVLLAGVWMAADDLGVARSAVIAPVGNRSPALLDVLWPTSHAVLRRPPRSRSTLVDVAHEVHQDTVETSRWEWISHPEVLALSGATAAAGERLPWLVVNVQQCDESLRQRDRVDVDDSPSTWGSPAVRIDFTLFDHALEIEVAGCWAPEPSVAPLRAIAEAVDRCLATGTAS